MILGVIFFRVFHLFKSYYEFSYFNSIRANFFCTAEAVENSVMFVMRSFWKKMPWRSIFILFALSTLLVGILLSTYEIFHFSLLRYIWNSFWYISYTQSTIGYGDMTPRTHVGRFVVCFTIFIGVFLYSYIVSVVKISLTLTRNEQKFYSKIKSMRLGKANKIIIILLIQRWWRLSMKRRIKCNKLKDLKKFNLQLTKFNLRKLRGSHDKHTTIEHELKRISQVSSKEFKKLNSYLNPISSSEILSTKLCNLNYFLLRNIQSYKRNLKIRYDFEDSREDTLSCRSESRSIISSNSNASLQMLKKRAVKNLIQSKAKLTTITPKLNNWISSEEDYLYSNNKDNKS